MPVLLAEGPPESSPWGVKFAAMLHITNDSGLFRDAASLEAEGWQADGNRYRRGAEECVPLYEAKLLHHFDHRFSTYAGQTPDQANMNKCPELTAEEHADPTQAILPRHWVPAAEVAARLRDRWDRGWLLGWRDITNTTNERTVIAAILPRAGVGNTYPLMITKSQQVPALYANLCCYVLDYAARQKVGGTHLNYLQIKQLPILPPERYAGTAPWDPTAKDLAAWLLPRVVELTYTAWDLEAFGQDCGYPGPPFRWNEARRFQLRCELDAAYFHLYGIERDDVAYIMDSFPIVRKADEKAHGHFRTRDTILALYDQLREAERTGVPYLCPLDPPPADPRQAHHPREAAAV